jgi:PLP dependent protein
MHPNPFLEGLDGRLARIREEVAEAAQRSGRSASSVRLVAVTKGHPFSVVEAALEVGLLELGENRVEALLERAPQVAPELGVHWHMIGRLQRRQAGELHALSPHLTVHSVDSVRLGERLHRTAPEGAPPLPILLQCNTSGEEAKTGFSPHEVEDGLGALLEFPSLRVEGLMTMAPFTDDERVLRATFAGLRELSEQLRRAFPGFRGTELSMGMSNDYSIAVEEGSTLLRLGTVLFGERAMQPNPAPQN